MEPATSGAAPTTTARIAGDPRTLRGKLLQLSFHPDTVTGMNLALNSIDCHPTEPLFAVCSIDKRFSLWRIKAPGEAVKANAPGSTSGESAAGVPPRQPADIEVEYLFHVEAHDAGVNTVRFSPNGECIATAGDDHTVVVWHPRTRGSWSSVRDRRDLQARICRGALAEVSDIAWSPDSRYILAGCVDNAAIVLDARGAAPRPLLLLGRHTDKVQGVAWDPAGAGVVTQSIDRTVKVFAVPLESIDAPATSGGRTSMAALTRDAAGDVAPAFTLATRVMPPSTVATPSVPLAAGGRAAGATDKHPLYLDDTLPSFFRRPAFTPDGALLLTPAGFFRASPDVQPTHTTYAFARGGRMGTPLAHFPGPRHGKPSVAVRVSPVVYTLRARGDGGGDVNNGVFTLPYRLVFAVATLDSVFVWDTQSTAPIAMMTMFHCEKITDLSWTSDGRALLISSLDGYISVATFAAGDLGTPLPTNDPAYPPLILRQKPSFYAHEDAKAKAAKKTGAADTSVPSDTPAVDAAQPPAPTTDAAAAPAVTADAAATPVVGTVAAPHVLVPVRRRIVPDVVSLLTSASTAAAAAAAAAARAAAQPLTDTPAAVAFATEHRALSDSASASAVAVELTEASSAAAAAAAAASAAVVTALGAVPSMASPQRVAAASSASPISVPAGGLTLSPPRRRITPIVLLPAPSAGDALAQSGGGDMMFTAPPRLPLHPPSQGHVDVVAPGLDQVEPQAPSGLPPPVAGESPSKRQRVSDV